MIKKINDFLSGLPMTIVAGIFLLIDLIPHLWAEFGKPVSFNILPFDPAWVTDVSYTHLDVYKRQVLLRV